jgi:sugar phosphate isomerase/epimerase
MFIRRVEPVVKTAEKLGVTLAIEPVYKHIVCDGKRARRVLDAVASPNLQIILDPVNLLHPDNLDRRDEVIAEAIELLGREIAVIHIKDYVNNGTDNMPCMAAGLGEMDYSAVLRFAKLKKPYIQMTFEETRPENAQAAREHIQRMLDAIE